MTKAFLTVFSLSFSGAFLAIVMMILQRVFSERLSKQVFYWLYALSIVRTLMPTYFGANIFSLVDTQNNTSPNFSSTHQNPFIFLLIAVWGIVCVCILVKQVRLYHLYTKQLLSEAINVESPSILLIFENAKRNLKINRKISLKYTDTSSPMIVGLFNPIIYIPYDCKFDDETLFIVFEHELTHYKRKDILIKWISILALAVHWFNPFVFYMKKKLEALCELSCDEHILQNKTQKECISYGDAIVNLVFDSNKQSKYAYHFSATAQTIKDRLYNISDVYKYARLSKKLIAILCIFFLLIYILLGSFPLVATAQNSVTATTNGSNTNDNYQVVTVEGDITNFNNTISIG